MSHFKYCKPATLPNAPITRGEYQGEKISSDERFLFEGHTLGGFGLTKLEYFACFAMEGLIARGCNDGELSEKAVSRAMDLIRALNELSMKEI